MEENVKQNEQIIKDFVDKHVIKSVSVKVFESKKGTKCTALKVDLGYRYYLLNFDTYKLAEIMDISVHTLTDLPMGDYELIKVKR